MQAGIDSYSIGDGALLALGDAGQKLVEIGSGVDKLASYVSGIAIGTSGRVWFASGGAFITGYLCN